MSNNQTVSLSSLLAGAGLNSPPVAQPDSFSDAPNHVLTGNVLADNGHGADTDPNGYSLSAVAQTIQTAAGGTAVMSSSGNFSYTPGTDFTGSDSFTYTLENSKGGSDIGTVNVTVQVPQPVAQEDDFNVVQGHTLTGNVLANNGHGADSDPDGRPLSVAPITAETAPEGTLTLNADGTFVFTPAAGFSGNVSFNYTLMNDLNGSSTGTVNIFVDKPPVAQEDDFTGNKNQTITGNVLANNGHGADSDPDGGTLTVAATTLTTVHGGNVILNANGTFTYTPAHNYFGADTFNYTLLDGQGGSATGTVDLTIKNALLPPVAQNDSISGTTDHVVTGNVLANNGHGADSDPNGLPLSVQAETLSTATGGHVVVNANGTFTYNGIAGFTGTDSFNYTITDGQATASATVTLTINAPSGAIVGTSGNNILNGTNNADIILGLAGNDTINAKNGGDHIYGGTGNDTVNGGNGNDVITGGQGADNLNGGAGNDILVAGDAIIQYHNFSSSNVLFPNVQEGVNISHISGGNAALGVVHGDMATSVATTATITFDKSVAGYSDSLGSFEIATDGTIKSVAIDFTNAHDTSAGATATVNVDANTQLGLFVISNGATLNHNYSNINLETGSLHFYYDYGKSDQRLANINDSGSHVSLVYTDSHNHNTVLQGSDYFTTERGGSTAINSDNAIHVVSGLTSSTDTTDLRVGFEDLSNKGDADYNDVLVDVNFSPVVTPVATANDSGNILNGGDGNDILYAGSGGGDILTGGSGADRFIFTALTAAPDTVSDFNAKAGDVLDL